MSWGSHCSWVCGLAKINPHEVFNKVRRLQSHCLGSSAWDSSKLEHAGTGGISPSAGEEQNGVGGLVLLFPVVPGLKGQSHSTFSRKGGQGGSCISPQVIETQRLSQKSHRAAQS